MVGNQPALESMTNVTWTTSITRSNDCAFGYAEGFHRAHEGREEHDAHKPPFTLSRPERRWALSDFVSSGFGLNAGVVVL